MIRSRVRSAGRPSSETVPCESSRRAGPAPVTWLTSCSTTSMVVPSSRDPEARLVEPLDHDGGQAQRDLVDEEEPRVAHEPPADGERLLLAAREVRPRLVATLEQGEELVHARQGPAPWPAAVGADEKVLLDGEAGEDAPPFGHKRRCRGPPARGRGGRPPARRRSARADAGPAAAGDRSKQRGLAGAVGADDGDRLAFVGLERHVEERLEVSVEGVRSPDAQQAHCTSIPR